MSIEHCNFCGSNIDTDINAEHFPCEERLVPARGGSAVLIPVRVKRERQEKARESVKSTIEFLTLKYSK